MSCPLPSWHELHLIFLLSFFSLMSLVLLWVQSCVYCWVWCQNGLQQSWKNHVKRKKIFSQTVLLFGTCITLWIVIHFPLGLRVELFVVIRVGWRWEALWKFWYQSQYIDVRMLREEGDDCSIQRGFKERKSSLEVRSSPLGGYLVFYMDWVCTLFSLFTKLSSDWYDGPLFFWPLYASRRSVLQY